MSGLNTGLADPTKRGIVTSAMAEVGYEKDARQMAATTRNLRGNTQLWSIIKNNKGPTGKNPLMFAAMKGDVGRAKFLLEQGANPNETDMNGISVVMYATQAENPEPILQLLVEKGAKLEEKNQQGSTALASASDSGNVKAVRALCAAGANVNTVDNDGSTPLISVITNIQLIKTPNENVKEIVDILLSKGANPDIADNKGITLEMFINGHIKDEELKESLLARIKKAREGGAAGGAQGGGSRRERERERARARAKAKARKTRGKGKKAKKAKGKTRKARS